jgi:hypothetical protein
MAVNKDALTTLANLKEQIGIATADTSKDTQLEKIINRATTWIESQTGRKLKARGYNGISGSLTLGGSDTITNEDYIFFSGTRMENGGDTLLDATGCYFHIPQYPVQLNSVLPFALAVLSSRSGGIESWDATAHVENDTFFLDRQNGILRLIGGVFTTGTRNYRITCAAGFIVGSAQPYVPGDLEDLCIQVAKKLYRNEQGLQSESLGTWSRSYNTEKENAAIDATLAHYRRF